MRKVFRFLAQTVGAALVVIVEATIHYKIHPITADLSPSILFSVDLRVTIRV